MKKRILKSLLFLSGSFIVYAAVIIGVKLFIIMGPSKAEQVDLSQNTNELLVVIDIQKKYMNAVPPPFTSQYIANINKLIDHSNKHSAKVVYLAAVRKSTLISLLFKPDIAVQGSASATLDSRLITENPVIFEKFRADGFYQNDFRAFLTANKIKRLVITGVAAEVCVGETVKGALNKGYEVVVIHDAIISFFGKKSLDKSIASFVKFGATAMSTDHYLQQKPVVP